MLKDVLCSSLFVLFLSGQAMADVAPTDTPSEESPTPAEEGGCSTASQSASAAGVVLLAALALRRR